MSANHAAACGLDRRAFPVLTVPPLPSCSHVKRIAKQKRSPFFYYDDFSTTVELGTLTIFYGSLTCRFPREPS
jgi:hypothetical protein